MTIQENIERIGKAKNKIIDALKSKGADIDYERKIQEIPAVIENLTTGGSDGVDPIYKDIVNHTISGELHIPNEMTNIKDYTFDENSNLTKVYGHANITSIGNYAFEACTKLTNVDLSMCTNLTRIRDYAFDRNIKLTNISLPQNTNIDWGEYVFDNCGALESIDLGNTTNIIRRYFFNNCKKLGNITGIDNVKIIDENAFQACFYNTKYQNVLCSIKFNDIIFIGNGAFKRCTYLNEIYMYPKNEIPELEGVEHFKDIIDYKIIMHNAIAKEILNTDNQWTNFGYSVTPEFDTTLYDSVNQIQTAKVTYSDDTKTRCLLNYNVNPNTPNFKGELNGKYSFEYNTLIDVPENLPEGISIHSVAIPYCDNVIDIEFNNLNHSKDELYEGYNKINSSTDPTTMWGNWKMFKLNEIVPYKSDEYGDSYSLNMDYKFLSSRINSVEFGVYYKDGENYMHLMSSQIYPEQGNRNIDWQNLTGFELYFGLMTDGEPFEIEINIESNIY